MILVTGAMGNLGAHIIEHLLKTNRPGQIMAQDRAAKWTEKGVQVRIGDYRDTDSPERAFSGEEKLLPISGLHEGILEQRKMWSTQLGQNPSTRKKTKPNFNNLLYVKTTRTQAQSIYSL